MEMIVVMTLTAVIGVFTSLLLVPLAEGFLDAETNAEHVEKTQLVMMRLEKEVGSITNVITGTSQQLRYEWLDPQGTVRESELSWQGGAGTDPLLLNNAPLVSGVERIEIAYYTKSGTRTAEFRRPEVPTGSDTVSIGVGIDYGIAGSTFTNVYHLRNLPQRSVP